MKILSNEILLWLFFKSLRLESRIIFPLSKKITLSQISFISFNKCEEKITILFFAKILINYLISNICEGSKPVVGSSKINISGA